MARKGARLYIDSDVSGVQKGVGKAQSSLRGFEKDAKRTQSVMGGLSSTAGSLGLALGVGGLAIGINQSLTAFKDQEKQMARVVATLKTLGVNTDAVRKKVLAVTDAQSRLSGFQDDELQASYATILRVNKDVTESFKLNALAMDIARGSGKDLQVVALAIAKVADGNANALARYGVKAQKGATSTDVLAEAQKRYAGQAKEFGDSAAGSAERADVAIDQLKQSFGGKLAPAMEEAASATIKLSGATGSFIDHAGGIGPIVAGGAGFGAFKLLAPSILNAGSALGQLGQVAGTKGAGASFRVLGSAVAASVSPMTAAGVGAGLLAGGIYELWHTSENADQAVQGLNDRINGLNTALDQKRVAKDAVNSAKDYVKSTRDAEAAARSRARALHADLAELVEHKGSTEKVAAATAKWRKAMEDVVPTVHARQRAETQLDGAQKNLQKSTEGVTAAAAKQNDKARDVVNKVLAQTAAVQAHGKSWREYGKDSSGGVNTAGAAANRFAALMDKAARATKNSDKAVSTADTNLAGFARHIGRLPTIREIKLVTKYTAEGLSLDEIKRKIDGMRSKTITLTTKVNPITGNVVTSPPKPKRTGPPFKPTGATGGYVAGSYSAGDIQPAMLAGEEAVLTPQQQDLVDSGMTVDEALRATGAPTIGGAFAKGKRPVARYVRSNLTGVKRTTLTPTEQARKAIEKRKVYFGLQLAGTDQDIANAAGSETIDDDLAAYKRDVSQRRAYQDWLGKVLRNPGKTLGFPGAKLSVQDRTDLIGEQTAQTRAINDDARAIFELLHPDATPAETDAGAAAVGAESAGPDADLLAQLDRQKELTRVATRGSLLSDAALAILTSPGDIGSSNYGNTRDAGAGITINTLHPGDSRTLAAIAGAAAQGFGLQPSVTANRASILI